MSHRSHGWQLVVGRATHVLRASVKAVAKVVDLYVVSAPPAVMGRAPSPSASPGRRWLTAALAALTLVVSVVSACVLLACVVDKAFYDRDRIGQAGWKLNLTIGALAAIIIVFAFLAARVLSQFGQREPGRNSQVGSVVAVMLIPGLWLGGVASVPIRTALRAASGSASPEIPDGETGTAVTQLATQMHAPAGWTRVTSSCTRGYVCWTSPHDQIFTASSYGDLARQFGIRAVSSHCDVPLVGLHNGRAVQSCLSGGVAGRYEVVVTLLMRRALDGQSGTDFDAAPVRRLS